MESINATSVIAEVDARWGSTCAACAAALIGHDVVLSLIGGHKDAPRCADCLAAALGRSAPDHVRLVAAHVRRLACYRAGWRHADGRLRAEGAWPHPRVPSDIEMPDLDDDDEEAEAEIEGPASTKHEGPLFDREFDAGDMSCGDLVLELRLKLRELAPGAVLRVRATDPGARGDLPAWCRITGHAMLHTHHPLYWIRRRP